MPDTVINSARIDSQSINYIDPNQGTNSTSGFTSSMNSGMMSSLNELGQARGQLLSIKLD